MTEIAWRPWGEEVFADAQRQNKPVFLSLFARWCRFCKNMDAQTYSNDAIAQYINEQFIPVRVDTDQRPDINTRYSQGGWPSTCVLTPDGDVLWGGTFVPADQMAQLLPQVLNEFRNNKPGVAAHVAKTREQLRAQNSPPPLDAARQITPEVTRLVILNAKHNFDFAFGGFGHGGHKFPHTETVELLLEQFSASLQAGTPDTDTLIMLRKTLVGITDGALHDKDGQGGFFRYAQTVDWRDPQVEKLLEDSAQLTRLFCRAYQLLGDEKWLETARRTLRYLDEVLYNDADGTWGGSQFADAEYYAQPIAERAEWNPPTVDPTVFAGPNALAVRAHVAFWAATGDTDALARAQRGMDYLLAHLLLPDGALLHFAPTEEDPSIGRIPTGLLADAADMTAACLDLYEAGKGGAYLDHAITIATWVRGHLEDPRSGGLFDAVVRPDAVGNLKVGTKDVPDNTQMADALLRLYLATSDDVHGQLAHRILQAFAPVLPQIGFLGAGFVLAAERLFRPPLIVHLVGSPADPKTAELSAAAHRPYRFTRIVVPCDPTDEADAEYIRDLGYDIPSEPLAYLTLGATKLDPIDDPAKLTETVAKAVLQPAG